MKKMIFGALVTIVGLMYSLTHIQFAYSKGAKIFEEMIGYGIFHWFVISLLIMIAGIIICGREVYFFKDGKKSDLKKEE